MFKRITGKLVDVYAVLFAIFVVLLPAWYKRHSADYYAYLGFVVGLVVSIFIIAWAVIFQ